MGFEMAEKCQLIWEMLWIDKYDVNKVFNKSELVNKWMGVSEGSEIGREEEGI